MDEQRRLIQAITLDGEMTRPTRYDGKNRPVGPWVEAEILEATITLDHRRGWYFGAVRYVPKSTRKVKLNSELPHAVVRTFHDLWMEGWTSIEYRKMVLDARKVDRRKGRR
jgi:hypothetical protein